MNLILNLLSLYGILICICHSYESRGISVDSLRNPKADSVDSKVKMPIRICRGFEDPSDTDCYMRTDIKTYVCTEPITFNPCESKTRVTVWHYDHIKHKCYQTSVPVCAGNIIRDMTLIQCLIYCHNKDPYALGKSRSTMYKLNQKKPYISDEEEKKNVDLDANFKSLTTITPKPKPANKPKKSVKKIANDDSYSTSLNGNAELAEYLVENLKKKSSEEDEGISGNESKSRKPAKKLEKDSKIGGMEMDVITDSTDTKSVDYGFYAWDE